MKRNILIINPRIARDLIQKNYKLVDISENKKIPGRTVFYFDNTKEIRDYLKQTHNLDLY